MEHCLVYTKKIINGKKNVLLTELKAAEVTVALATGATEANTRQTSEVSTKI